MANLSTDIPRAPASTSEYKNKILNGDHQLEKMAQNAGERVGTMATDWANSTAEKVKSSREYVKANPMKGVIIAAATGVVAGSCLTMLMRGRRASA